MALGSESQNVTKISYKDDSRQRFQGTIIIHDQDHTIGNVIRYQLLQNPNVRFAGYKKPHPLEEKIEIKVQTNGEIPPPDAVLESCDQLNLTIGNLISSFKEEIEKFKVTGAAPMLGNQED